MPIAISPKSADLGEGHRPGEQERDLEIENDEQDGDQVVAHVEAHARIFIGIEAALVRRELLRIALGSGSKAAEKRSQAEHDRREARGNDQEDQDR